jgi:LytS/YehU family sensor histidine kinase
MCSPVQEQAKNKVRVGIAECHIAGVPQSGTICETPCVQRKDMAALTSTLNTFFQNTCVIVVFAYVLTRTRLMPLLFLSQRSIRDVLTLGGAFGLMGLLELFFASSRFPYDTYTLIVTFAVINAGLRVGLVAALILTSGSILMLPAPDETRLVLSVLLTGGIAFVVRRLTQEHHRTVIMLAAVVLAEFASIALRLSLPIAAEAPFDLGLAVARLIANGVGIILLQWIVNDAQTRVQSEQFRAEAEHSRTLAAEAQLTALRARIHPHFLYNTLTSIASLCSIAPDKAESTIIQLGHIMRRSMERSNDLLVSLSDELIYLREYVEIEQLRFGDRLRIVWNIAPNCLSAQIPPFALQILVENAINHGLSAKTDPGTVTITARRQGEHILIAVQDDGVGMTPETKRRALLPDATDRYHGMQTLSQQLMLLYSNASRLHLFTAPDRGTCAAFCLPAPREDRATDATFRQT